MQDAEPPRLDCGLLCISSPTHQTEWPTPAWSGGSRERIAMRKIVKPIPASRSASTASAKRPRAALLAAFARYMRPANRARERSRYLALIALRRPAGYDCQMLKNPSLHRTTARGRSPAASSTAAQAQRRPQPWPHPGCNCRGWSRWPLPRRRAACQ